MRNHIYADMESDGNRLIINNKIKECKGTKKFLNKSNSGYRLTELYALPSLHLYVIQFLGNADDFFGYFPRLLGVQLTQMKLVKIVVSGKIRPFDFLA